MSAALALLLLAPAAPAPLPRHVSARDVAGTWSMQWVTSEDTVTFYKDGRYTCHWGQSTWTGTWSIHKGVLKVVETHPEAPSPFTWFAPLKRQGTSLTSPTGHYPFVRLLPPPPP